MNLRTMTDLIAQEVTLEVEDAGVGLVYRDHGREEASADVIAQRLASYIYGDFHAGLSSSNLALGSWASDPALGKALEAVTPRRYREVRARYLREVDDKVTSEVDIAGVRVAVELQSASSTRSPNEIVSVEMQTWRPRLSPGYFLTESAERPFVAMGPMVRLYLHIEVASNAPATWGEVTALLYALGVPFKAKVLAIAEMYPRNDALVVYLTRPSWQHIAELAEKLSRFPGVVAGTSTFAREIQPGVGLAFEPIDSRAPYRQMSFGQHRAMVVANTLVDHALHVESADDSLAHHAQLALVDLDDPWRNTSSPDVLLYL